jgi:hypothetical protein
MVHNFLFRCRSRGMTSVRTIEDLLGLRPTDWSSVLQKGSVGCAESPRC